ncbi:MAG: DUF4747 domain-containing protein [Oceanospirillum sp.]|nr:DUF4747 domain-containing protein [Oceanospirillum sp.]
MNFMVHFQIEPAVYKLQGLIKSGPYGMMIGSLKPSTKDPSELGLSGEIYRFIHLDPNEPWFNSETKEEASENDLQEIQIPNHLLPGLKKIPFVFKPNEHELWFVSSDRKNNLAPKSAAAFFERLFEHPEIQGKYPEIAVTALPDKNSLDDMFATPVIDRLTIELKRPNADDAGKHDEKFMKKLEKMHVRRQKTEYLAEKNSSIEPDNETKLLADIASKNGKVVIAGKNIQGVSIEKSTEDTPYLEPVLVNPETGSAVDTLRRVAGID